MTGEVLNSPFSFGKSVWVDHHIGEKRLRIQRNLCYFFSGSGLRVVVSWWFNMKDLHRICCRLCSIIRFFNDSTTGYSIIWLWSSIQPPSVPKILHLGNVKKSLQLLLRPIGLLQSPQSWLSYIPKDKQKKMDCLQKRCGDVLPSTSAMGESQKLTKKKSRELWRILEFPW